MAFKNIISSILTTFLGPNRVTTKAPPPVCKNADTSAANEWSRMSECAVCLSSLVGEKGTRVLPCRHEFHIVCVDRWLAVPYFKNTCPICRFSMEEDCEPMRVECFLTEEMVIWFSSFHVAGF